jgi:hypothetical protein
MNKRKQALGAFLIIIGLFAAVAASATTIAAASSSRNHVQSAIDSAATGDIVVVPTGSSVWTSEVSIPNGKRITLKGAGIGSTVISRTSFGLVINMNGSGSRVTGIEFVEGQILVNGVGWRIDHCKISTAAFQDGITVLPASVAGSLHPTGVIDHCEMVRCRILVMGGWYDNMSWGNARWHEALGLGTDYFVFIEDNLHNLGGVANAVDSNLGGRYVFRHNTVNDGWIEAHSIQGTHRATRCWEIYNNTISRISATQWFPPFRIRGGTGVIFNNTITGDWSAYGGYNVMLDNIRSCNSKGVGGIADGTSPWDGNTLPIEIYQGYPARDQIGRSTDQWLWTDANPYPPQALDPAYFWNNKKGATEYGAVLYQDCGRQAIHIVKNRDYYEGTPKPGYTPYTYPHPLIQWWDGNGDGDGMSAPAAPTGLRIQS